ncbi:hypothetical protein SPSYN_01561 [Sporotomaculum syntrophicum]|uniref:Uncharacterized protein n=1 Tax=Sporotomaculum syntrophicum TaxID=182264 RepID=A0A9D3AXV9_9FIRM|nr:hypothetical protein [Sporotomaculum syntrophicum]KAF1085422.1 hypothetical protein SPSYN_01561 [Sporotomaculum syntrophicum]
MQETKLRWVKGKITNIAVTGVWNEDSSGTAYLFIHMDELKPVVADIPETKRVVIVGNHPAFAPALQMALSAKASDSEITLYYTETTHIRSNAWDFVTISFEQMRPGVK